MTREEIKENLELNDRAIFLEPEEILNNAIIGCTEDRDHLIYDQELMLGLMAADFSQTADEDEDPLEQAVEWFSTTAQYEIARLHESGKPVINYTLRG